MTTKLLLLPLALALTAAAAEPTTLHLTITGLRSSNGAVRLCVWRDEAGFPDCKKNPNVVTLVAPAASVVEIDVGKLPPGDYAVSAIHDENNNSKLDKSFVGKPTEGIAFSNDVKVMFGPPKFAKVRFSVTGKSTHTMRMRYFL